MRTVQILTCTQAAYVAGIVDGEGTITLTRLHRGEQRRLVVSVSNNERGLLEFLRESIGGGRITNKRTYSPEHAPSYTYQITSRQALDLLQQIEPYLQTYKSIRACMALSSYVALTPRNGKYNESLRAARNAFERAFLAVSNGSTDA